MFTSCLAEGPLAVARRRMAPCESSDNQIRPSLGDFALSITDEVLDDSSAPTPSPKEASGGHASSDRRQIPRLKTAEKTGELRRSISGSGSELSGGSQEAEELTPEELPAISEGGLHSEENAEEASGCHAASDRLKTTEKTEELRRSISGSVSELSGGSQGKLSFFSGLAGGTGVKPHVPSSTRPALKTSTNSPQAWRPPDEAPGEERRKLFRRSMSQGSKVSSGGLSASSGGSLPTDQTSTSDPQFCPLKPMRDRSYITVNTVATAHDNFDFMELLGKGSFGDVWRGCRKMCADEMFAIKRIPVGTRKQEILSLEKELKVFERMNCPHMVDLHEVFLEADYLYLVMDLCTGGNLQSYLDTYVDEPDRLLRKMEFPDDVLGLPARLVGQLLWQMLAGIAYMHHHLVVHRDVKLRNFMIKEPSKKPTLQLIDFGLAIRIPKGGFLSVSCGTVKYMAPEVLMGRYNEKCDIWAIGIVCYILCTEKSPWPECEASGGHNALKQYIKEDIRAGWPRCDKPAVVRSLVDSMMKRDIGARPSAKTLLKTSRWLRKHSQADTSTSCCAIA